MRTSPAAIVLLFTFSLANAHAQKPQEQSTCCSIVEQALTTAQNIKPGMTRADVEKNFVMDGGLDFRGTSFYTYKACPLIKICVNFLVPTPVSFPDSPKDVVKSVSETYLQNPARD